MAQLKDAMIFPGRGDLYEMCSFVPNKELVMDLYEEDGCRLEDWVYPNGSQMCCQGDCMICRDGEWDDLDVEFKESELS